MSFLNQAKPVAAALFLGSLSLASLSAKAGIYNLTIDEVMTDIGGELRPAMGINGQIPGPELRFREGEEITLNVTNNLEEDSSIHWHGLILPYQMDGVPGISFDGIKPGETFTYKFTANQNGTYWYHSHSGLQEQAGVYGPLVIDAAKREPFRVDRDYTILLSDWTNEDPNDVLANLKKQSDYYNYGQRTVGDFFEDVAQIGLAETISDRVAWGNMRMTPTDIADVSGYTFLVNGRNPDQNWTGLFKPGERVRLRFINGSAMSYFDVRIPGLEMTVVQADGNNVKPVKVDEFRIAVAETYDVIVRPKEDTAYQILAESIDRTGFARATLTAEETTATPALPKLRERPLLTMADMGMDHGAMEMDAKGETGDMAGMDHSNMAGMSGDAMKSGIAPEAANGGKILVYGDLKSLKAVEDYRAPEREIELRLTGNMERYYWSINGIKYSDADPVKLAYGERVRIKFVNETMMSHPMHLHGMWMQLDTGKGEFNPLKHTVNVPPGQTLTVDVTADALGEWAFHCHLLYHMATGMFRKVVVEETPDLSSLTAPVGE
ncbi:copper resistance system multicopper oxidase [Aestuariispira insulae]|uniref:L-ascorbate oxidase n=1 Tax=Aestuariispira insulae TaxID=1461337 RepID=A0A3D9HE80_9PROT|nr:copper resistance system multicopper oxidase [Aestuariispira insulae]RED47773.1 L-ascorbate oxidase [Aestuariispira insulae]